VDYLVVFGLAALSVLLTTVYFRRCEMTRPPIGVFNLRDVAVVLGAIVVIPYLYLVLPLAVVATIIALTVLGTLYLVGEPLVPRRVLLVAIAGGAVAADIAIALVEGTASNLFLAANDLLLVAVVVAVANLWAQSGMKARDAAVLAGALAVYDYIATSQLTLMTDLIDRLSTIPFQPFVGWRSGADGLAVGLGDLLLASVFPLVMRKAYGRRAGATAVVSGVAVLALILGLIKAGVITFVVPAMVVLGPLMVVQYAFWARRRGGERTTWAYLRAEPRAAGAAA
jgi:hypothetical protein